MYSLQLLLRASHAALLLVICLQLGINKAQEDTKSVWAVEFLDCDSGCTLYGRTTCFPGETCQGFDKLTRQLIKMDFQLPRTTKANEEVTATLRIATELRECMVIKTYLLSNSPVDGPFNYKYTACLCEEFPRTFFWDFQVNSTVRIAAVVDIIREFNICPNDMAVIPIKANRFSVLRTLAVA